MEEQEQYVEEPVEEQVETTEQTAQEAEQVEETEESATSPAESDAEEEPEGKKHKGGFQKRIDELTRRYYEEQQRAQAYERQLQELQQQHTDTQHQAVKPKFENYSDPEQFENDLAEWYRQGVERQQEAQKHYQQQVEDQQKQAQKHAQLQQRVAEGSQKYQDFTEVVMNPALPPLSQVNEHAFEALTESDHFADVAYYLGNNPHEILQFQGMSPVQAAKRVYQLEQRVQKPAKPKTTKAPNPPPEVGSKSDASEDLSKVEDMDAWMKKRQQQVQSRK